MHLSTVRVSGPVQFHLQGGEQGAHQILLERELLIRGRIEKKEEKRKEKKENKRKDLISDLCKGKEHMSDILLQNILNVLLP